MVSFCAILGCGNKAGKTGCSFFRLPAIKRTNCATIKERQERRRIAWIKAINRENITENKYPFIRVCSLHFLSGKPSELADVDNPDWIPNQNMGRETSSGTSQNMKRINQGHSKDEIIFQNITHTPSSILNFQQNYIQEVSVPGVSTQTDMTGDYIQGINDSLIYFGEQINTLKNKVAELEFSENSFRNNQQKIVHFTGLTSWKAFEIVYDEVSSFIRTSYVSTLTKFQQLLLTLMKLRLNYPFTDLAYMFHISRRTVSRIFYNTLEILNARLYNFVFWPDRVGFRKSMPISFRKALGNSVIIDQFEIFIEKPSDLIAKTQTWSNNKRHNTVKYLIGVCPQGVISFVSEGWCGGTIDKQITKESGLLKSILPGNMVLADFGFNISEEVGFCCASVNSPALTKGKKELVPHNVEKTARNHVKRLLAVLSQKYKILSGPIPLEFLTNRENGPACDKFVRVCCALTNLCPSVAPFKS